MRIKWKEELDEAQEMSDEFESIKSIVEEFEWLIDSRILIEKEIETFCDKSQLEIELEKEEDDNKYDVENVVDLLILLRKTVGKDILIDTPLLNDEDLDLDKKDYLHGVPPEMMKDGED